MATLAFNFEEIAPREFRPEVYELHGISRAAVEAHYKLYQGYVAKRNEILGKLAGVDLASANQTYSEIRALKVELTFAIGVISEAAGAIPRARSPRSSSATSARSTPGAPI